MLVNDPTNTTKRTHDKVSTTEHALEASKEWVEHAVGKTLLLVGYERTGFEYGR